MAKVEVGVEFEQRGKPGMMLISMSRWSCVVVELEKSEIGNKLARAGGKGGIWDGRRPGNVLRPFCPLSLPTPLLSAHHASRRQSIRTRQTRRCRTCSDVKSSEKFEEIRFCEFWNSGNTQFTVCKLIVIYEKQLHNWVAILEFHDSRKSGARWFADSLRKRSFKTQFPQMKS